MSTYAAIMSEPTSFNEARVLTELKGYSWKLSMMLKLSSAPVEQIEKDLKMMAQVVDSIPESHPLTKKWTAKLERLFEKLLLNRWNDFPAWFKQQIDHKSAEECQEVSSVKASSSSDYQLSIPNCRSTSPTEPINLTIDFHFTLNCPPASFAENDEVTAAEMTLYLSFGFNPSNQEMGRIMAPPLRSHSTEAIRQIVLDANTEVNYDTVYSKIREAFDRLKPIEEVNQKEGVRDLVVLLVKCRLILRALNPKRKNLEKTIFNWAYFKLNCTLAQTFKHQRTRMVLINLITFLTRLLTKMSHLTTIYPLSMVCYYCKHPGHFVRSCPSTHLITCFNCFQMGHTRRRCFNEKVDPMYLLENL